MNLKLSIPSLLCHHKTDSTCNSKILQPPAPSLELAYRICLSSYYIVVQHHRLSTLLFKPPKNSVCLTYCFIVCLRTSRYCKLQTGHSGKWEKKFVITLLWRIPHRSAPKQLSMLENCTNCITLMFWRKHFEFLRTRL